MNINKLQFPKTKAEAQQQAIDWQQWQGKRSLSYFELSQWATYFRKTGKRFGLLREFRENGIV